MAPNCSRRDFIRKSAIGATGVGLIGLSGSPRQALGYVNQDPINPSIDNLRVVYLIDATMTFGDEPADITWEQQNARTDAAVVATNIDKMASALSQKSNVNEAWNTIFIKPPGKQWNQVVVAIKTNNNAMEHTRNAVMKKFCEVLVNEIGVTASNIHIYDSSHGGDMTTRTPWYDLPGGIQVESRWGVTGAPGGPWGGNVVSIALPPPYVGPAHPCQADIANGAIDILINIAICKGQSVLYGYLTMCAKNHYGTFRPLHDTDYLFSINKTVPILGAMDPGTGRILFPRQQLCFIDSLWACRLGPYAYASARPNAFFMGTFAPALDYQAGTKFRAETMGWPINMIVVDRLLTEFGYGPGDLPNGGDMIDASTWVPPYSLQVTIVPPSGGTVSRNPDRPDYAQGETVELRATAAPGYRFDRWEGDLVGSANPAPLLMDDSKSVTAVFNSLPLDIPLWRKY